MNYKNGITKIKRICPKCKKPKTFKSNICWKCYSIIRLKNKKIAKCVDCGKLLSRKNYKRCVSCAIKFRIKNKIYPYKNGNCEDKFCKKCNKKLISHNPTTKYCKRCWGKLESGKNNPNYGKNNVQMHKHHIYLKKNSKKTLNLTSSKHSKLHHRAYDYLVEIGLIDKYIKWFDKKYGLK